jgi:hypothetical protein
LHVDRLACQRYDARLDTGELQQLLDELDEAVRLALRAGVR